MKSRILLSVLACFILLASSLSTEAKIGFRQLTPTTPVAVQRGTKSIINLRSNFTLDGAYKVFFDKPGIRMTFLETEPIAAPRRGGGTPGTPFRFEADVPADQPLGVYECRVATKTAVSSVAHLLVTDYPVIQEQKKENGTPERAQKITFPAAVCGICERSEDVDYYRFAAKAGQEMTVNVYAQRVTEAVHSMQSGGGGGIDLIYLMDSILTLYGPNGRVIAQNEDYFGGDAFITCKLPETAEYVLEVRDARYVGNGKYVYCVEISDKPFAHAVFPMAVQQGTSVESEVVGHALGGVEKTTLTAAKNETPGWKTIQIDTPGGKTNSVPMLVSAHPQLLATGANNSRDSAMPLSIPVGVNGRFSKPEQTHYFSFNATKNSYYFFEVSADRYGLPLDCLIEVHDSNGKKLIEADDGQTESGRYTKDAQFHFKAPADGKYFISVRDLHDRGGERFFYHLRAEPSGPDFGVSGEYYYAQIAPGTHMMWFARIGRMNGFRGPVTMQIEGLPKGVSFTPVTIPAEMTHCSLILSAASDAKIDASLVRVRGTAAIPDANGKPRDVVRYGRVTCELQTTPGPQARCPIKTQLVGVTEPLDLLKVEALPNEITLKPGETVEITVRIKRNKGFKDPVILAMGAMYAGSVVLWGQLPPGITMSKASKARLTGETLEGKIILQAGTGKNKPAPVKRFPIAVVAPVAIGFSISTNYGSNPLYLTIPATNETARNTTK